MNNIVLIIEYDGTRYYGWQKQPGRRTLQETIESAIEKIVGQRVSLIASGRTDRGVHARAQVANFKINREIDLSVLKRALNATLPLDIRIKNTYKVDPLFHARFSAKKKVYYYYFSHFSYFTPVLRNYIWYIPYNFDIYKMEKVAKIFVGTHDFSAFKNSRGKWERKDDTVRTIYSSDIIKKRRGLYIYRISGNGFFYKMVRNIFGCIVHAGIGKITEEEVLSIFHKKRDRANAPPPAPPQGLFLVRVEYK